MPFPAYKFVKPEDAHYLEQGSLLLGSFASYSALEDKRGDDLDGQVRRSGSVHISDIGHPDHVDQVRRLATMGVHLYADPGMKATNIQITNFTANLSSGAFAVLCLSRRPVNAHWQKLGLTSVWEVPDVAALGDFIWHSFPNVLGRPRGEIVRYVQREFDLMSDVMPSPFRKRPRFAEEDEYRIVWPVKPGFTRMVVPLNLSKTPLIRPIRAG